MPKEVTKAPPVPDTHVLKGLMEEYLEMLRDAQRGIKKVLSLDPRKEEFWDALSDLDPQITMIEARSKSIQEESLDLLDQLPDD
ncbi:MAG: hypothetical protein LAO07_09480 [Acidobacteriia bacterium]|nr:hypothetical protein [Terriglobia bacterium]